MRGSKVKAIRKLTTQAIHRGVTINVLKSGDKQVLCNPKRYLYQFFKGKNSNLGFARQEAP